MIKIVWIENRIKLIHFAQLYNYQVCVGQVDFSMIGTNSATSREIWHSRLFFRCSVITRAIEHSIQFFVQKCEKRINIQKKERKSSSLQQQVNLEESTARVTDEEKTDNPVQNKKKSSLNFDYVRARLCYSSTRRSVSCNFILIQS